MRRFQFLGDGSEKFWEIDRNDASVTVRFGRIGTNGQTQTKDLGTEAAATAHVDKLIAEKVKKGYVEGDATSATRKAAPAAAKKKATKPTPTEPAAPASTQVAAEPEDLPDETTFTLPAAWSRQAEPFRGRRPAPNLKVDASTTLQQADALRKRMSTVVDRILNHRSSDASLVKRAELHLGTGGGLLRRPKQQDDAVGAAVHAMALCSALQWNEREKLGALVADELVVRHGPVFAAEAGAHLGSLVVTSARGAVYVQGGQIDQWIKSAQPNELNSYAIEPVLTRLRAHLAGLDEQTYADVVARLAALRQDALSVRVVISYLAPTEQTWVDDDVAALPSLQQGGMHWPMLLASATTRSQVDAIVALSEPWSIARRPELLYSITANVGSDVAGPLVTLFDKDLDAATKKRVLNMVAVLPTDEAFNALIDRIDQKYVSPVVIEAMGRFPARAMRLLAARTGGSDAKARSCKELLRGHLISNPGLAERLGTDLDATSAKALESIGNAVALFPVAPLADVPPVLASPPWEGRKRAAAPIVVTGLAPPTGLAVRWLPGEQQEWANLPVHNYWAKQTGNDWKAAVAQAVDPTSRYQYGALAILAAAPPDLVRPRLARYTPAHTWDALPAIRRILGGVGSDALAFTLRVVMSRPTSLAPALLPIEGAEVASRMAEWLVRAKSLRPLARAWLNRHPDAAARDLIPAALAKAGKDRAAAEAALRVLNQAGHRDTILRAASGYGDEALAAIEAALDVDPLDRLPAKVPALPAWLDPAHLPQVLLPGRQSALPPEAVGHICTMLAMSKPGDTYAGVDVVKDATDPASLAEMAWGLLERWQGAGFPSKEGWVLEALALVGDDETVRRLTPLIRTWPGDGAHARAVAGLDVLSAIGTDVALMHLHGIAEKAKFKGLKTKAREKMDEVADGLGLSAEQLADRLVPDFGLDGDGSMVLDYGPRRFRVGFDEQLKPIVADEDGSRRKILPKPSAKDDQVLATEAYATFSGLKKDVKTIATDQIRRFERAMVMGRRWTADEHRTLFVDHPLLWHLTRRLVWATFDAADVPIGSFRVAEDRTLANVEDDDLALDGTATVGIAHPLHLGNAIAKWSDLFADYEILQPFSQLGRETWQLTPDERKAKVLTRMSGVTIETGRILGLAHRGWDRGAVMDGGVSSVVQKQVAGGNVLVMDLDPGIIAGAAMEWKEQKIVGVWVSDGPVEWGNTAGQRPFATLDDITASELIRDLEHLRG